MLNDFAILRSDYYDGLEEELKALLPIIGSNIDFDSETWFCDKKKRNGGHRNNTYTIYFVSYPPEYCDIAKYYALMRIREKVSISTVSSDIWALGVFFQFIKNKHKGLELHQISKSLILDYEQYVRSLKHEKSSKEVLFTAINNFFKTMRDWSEMPDKMPIDGGNPFSRTKEDRKNDDKYISEFVTNQLDIIFKDERIPVTQRLLYWIPRSIPSRISEVTGMNFDCLKPSFQGKDYWVIFMPTWKQSGGYMKPEIRPIHLKEEGHGAYLINLIREQQAISKALQSEVKEKELLFTYKQSVFSNKLKIITNDKVHYEMRNVTSIANPSSVGKMFNRICERYDVRDENNKPYRFTSHQLRHNGITDRIYEGFNIIEIRDMTGHKGEQMIVQSYIHENPDKIKEKQQLVNSRKNDGVDKASVYFKGKILNMDRLQEERLLKNPRAHRIGRLGICSDITNCSGDLYECLSCDLFVPNADELDYFEEEVKQWSKKVEVFKSHQFMRENAEYNLTLNKKMVEKIKSTIR